MKDFFEQLKDIWAELGVSQKVSVIASSAVIILGVTGLLVWASQPNYQLLYGRLGSKDMSGVVSFLEEENIPYEMRSGGSSVYVSSEHVYSARMQLAAKGVPSGGGVGFEIFDKSNFGISDFVQRTNYNRAIQGELGRTISQLNGIESARVMIVVPENRLIAEASHTKPTASVFIETGGMQLKEDAVNSVRFLVANAVEGLNVNDVAVIDNHGNVLSEGLKSDGAMGASSGQMRYQQNLENYFTQKVESMLMRVVGAGNVVARVSVEVDREASTIFQEKFDPEGQVVRNQTISEDSSTNKETGGGQVVGQGAPDGGERQGAQASNEEKRKNKTVNYEINRSTVETVKRPGEVKKISASVLISERYEGEGDAATPKPRTEEEMQTIRSIVANALGVDANDTESQITVEEVAFQVEKPAVAGLLDQGGPIFSWIGLLKNFSSIFVAFIMFFILLRMVKKHKPQPINFELVDDGSGGGNPRATPDLLNELIRQKPENVSETLKNWVSKSESNN